MFVMQSSLKFRFDYNRNILRDFVINMKIFNPYFSCCCCRQNLFIDRLNCHHLHSSEYCIKLNRCSNTNGIVLCNFTNLQVYSFLVNIIKESFSSAFFRVFLPLFYQFCLQNLHILFST